MPGNLEYPSWRNSHGHKATMEEKRAIKAAKAMDLKVAGVDIIRSAKALCY
jgi:hypothetical protein